MISCVFAVVVAAASIAAASGESVRVREVQYNITRDPELPPNYLNTSLESFSGKRINF